MVIIIIIMAGSFYITDNCVRRVHLIRSCGAILVRCAHNLHLLIIYMDGDMERCRAVLRAVYKCIFI